MYLCLHVISVLVCFSYLLSFCLIYLLSSLNNLASQCQGPWKDLIGRLNKFFLTEGKILFNNIVTPSQEFTDLPGQAIDELYSNN